MQPTTAGTLAALIPILTGGFGSLLSLVGKAKSRRA